MLREKGYRLKIWQALSGEAQAVRVSNGAFELTVNSRETF
jgi:hypothetical protein